MLLRMTTLLPLLLVASLAGCRDRAVEQSRYHYHLNKLNKRWVAVRNNFQTETPDVYLVTVLNRDFAELGAAMRRTYKGSNRDELLPRLKELAMKFSAGINPLVGRTSSGGAILKPGATTDDVRDVIEKTYAEYQEFAKLVK